MWIAKAFRARIAMAVRVVGLRLTITSGGSREIEAKALTVTPSGVSKSPLAVTMVTPDANALIASLKRLSGTSCCMTRLYGFVGFHTRNCHLWGNKYDLDFQTTVDCGKGKCTAN